MLQAFIITLREGVEASLIVGIIFAYLSKIGRHELKRTVFSALAAAIAASIGVAYRHLPPQLQPRHLRGLGHARRRRLRPHYDLVHAPHRSRHEGRDRRQGRQTRRHLPHRPLLLRLPARPPRRRRDRPHPLRRLPQLHRATLLHRNPPRHRRSRSFRSPLHTRQRSHQPPALLPHHHRHPLLRHLPAHRLRPARALRRTASSPPPPPRCAT